MHIVALEARIIRLPLKRAIKHASHTRTDTLNIVVRCQLDDGSVGYGEGVPREYVTGETAQSSFEQLQRTDWAGQLRDVESFADAVAMAEALQLAGVDDDPRRCLGNAARCAVELAMLDALGNAFGETLMSVTQLLAPELYAPQNEVRYSGIILGSKPWKIRILATVYRWLGFQQVKIKVGVEGVDDVSRLKKLRRWLGSKMDIRIDANEAWPPEQATAKMQALELFDISSVEQPIRHEEFEQLANIRSQIKTPIMLDESLCGMVDAKRVVETKSADLFNIRLSKCGGFIPSLRLAQYAQEHGLGYQLGCQVGESGLLSAAGRQFATTVRGLRYIEGSYDRHLLLANIITSDMTMNRKGIGWMLTGTGLCVSVDVTLLEAVTEQHGVLWSE